MSSLLLCDKFSFKRDKWLVIYTFLAIFQPPFIPVSLIYLFGFITILLSIKYIMSPFWRQFLRISKIIWIARLFLVFFLYMLVIGLIDMIFIEDADTLSTRLRSINQLVILSFLEFCIIWFLLIQFYKRGYGLRDIVVIIALAGLIQCLFALSAFMIPQLRSLYMMFGDKNLYENAFFIERRGYGFSINLIDTFGYGMGLIAGYMILVRWTTSHVMLFVSLILMLFTIAVNARTGIVVFFIAVIVKLLANRSGFKRITIVGIFLILFIIIKSSIPLFLQAGMKSENATVSWISGSFNDMYYLLFASNSSTRFQMDEVGFLDHFIGLPENEFEFIFGKGHHVYDTNQTLGFRTDIGYLNLFWEFGIIGGSILLLSLFWLIGKPFLYSKNPEIRMISIFNLIAYGLVLMKAILIGFNPGVFVNYLSIFSIYYCMNKHKLHYHNNLKCIVA